MRKKVILITGAAGEIGQALVHQLSEAEPDLILTLDLSDMPPDIAPLCTHIKGSITDKSLLDRLVSEYEIDVIFHLAALLSTRAEYSPVAAHQVNVEGTLGLLELAAEQSQWRGKPVQFIYPSSIAVYGMPDLETKAAHPRVQQWEWNNPTTMYGANKLYGEQLGTYYSRNYKQLAEKEPVKLDFRAVRFPGLVSAFTAPSGGTSDYGPEMLHAAAKGEPYACFVRPDTTIPFMAMPDGVKALLDLVNVPLSALSRTVYNVTAFSLSADDFRTRVLAAFPEAQITFEPHAKRQAIVDSWPMDADDQPAREDWGWQPEYDVERSFNDYLIPNIRARYAK
ncbi:MAG: NAD-dependent epimerase/dehydratase family protein [Chloroflexi bacterium]|nr:NAD-dependent epimerase/dehydratase family protein [Chloroflexota bacterium]